LSPAIGTGILLMAIAPGVPFVLQAGGRARGGSLGFAISLAAILPALSVITVPITAAFVLTTLSKSPLPVTQFLTNLVLFQLLPLVLGVIVADRAPALASKLARPVLLVFVVTIVIVLVLLAPKIYHDLLTVYGSRGMLAALCLVLLSIATGWLLGGPERSYRRTLAIGTALRNVGLCALIATTSFSNTVAAAVMVYLLVQIIVVSLVGAYFKRTAAAGE
jgi:BASS family bile acid:Na+ symporter